tara:strand:- start:4410 stop:6044 length:1635 start_codon:yes stop_codon:yes gene_type:complete
LKHNVATPLIIKNLTVVNSRGQALLSEISVSLESGEILGVTGPTDSGKSLLGLAALGQIPATLRMTGGEVRVLQHSPFEDADRVRGKLAGLITQSPRQAFHPMMPIGKQVTRFRQHHTGESLSSCRERTLALMDLVGLRDPARIYSSFIHELSGGMAQRCLIALALSTEPKLLIADEPTSGLDVTIQANILDTIWRMTRDLGTSILLISQDRGVLTNYADKIVELDSGLQKDKVPVKEFISTGDKAKSSPATKEEAHRLGSRPVIMAVRHLSKTFSVQQRAYKGLWVRSTSLRAVDDFNVEIHEGESIGLVGESGSGKSTVGRCLMGLIDHDDGEILFRGRPISSLSASDRRRLRAKIQIVQQDPTDTFDPRRTLAWSLGEPFRIRKQSNERQVNIRVLELVERIGLDPTLLDSRPAEVTPSNLQQFAIARALATDPELIILDEPTSLLSPYDRESLLQLLGDLKRALSLSYLFISHDLHSVTAVCERVVIMQSGRIMESGLTGSTFSNPVNDYTQKLVDSFLDENPTVRRVEQHSVRSGKQVN